MVETRTTFIVGLGYIGAAVAEALCSRGERVVGTTRSRDKAQKLRARGIEAHALAAPDAHALASLWPAGAALLHTAPPVLDAAGADALTGAVLQATLDGAPRALVYLSTTGLYAERSGGACDESSAVAPRDSQARARLHAEGRYLERAAALAIPGIVFRLAGIYGPGRGIAARARAGRLTLWGGGDQIINRIHQADIVRFVIEALGASPEASGLYNLADDAPTSLRDYALEVTSRLGLPPPPEAPLEAAPSPTLTASKLLRSTRAQATFGLRLLYPSFREGLVAELDAES